MYHDKRVRINRNITSPQVRLIDMHGTMLGIKPLIEAVNMARGASLDLVEISPQANPPVCKVMDFNKYLYEKEKQERDNRKKQNGQRDSHHGDGSDSQPNVAAKINKAVFKDAL